MDLGGLAGLRGPRLLHRFDTVVAETAANALSLVRIRAPMNALIKAALAVPTPLLAAALEAAGLQE